MHHVLRQSPSQTPFRPRWQKAQSGTHNAKPRVVRGSGRLQSPLSRFEGLVLPGPKGFERSLPPHPPVYPAHHLFNLGVDCAHAVLPSRVAAQLLLALEFLEPIHGNLGLVAHADQLHKRFALAKALGVFACLDAALVLVFDLVEPLEVAVEKFGLTRDPSGAAVEPPDQRNLVRGKLLPGEGG